mgnify:CR=1 FL=1
MFLQILCVNLGVFCGHSFSMVSVFLWFRVTGFVVVMLHKVKDISQQDQGTIQIQHQALTLYNGEVNFNPRPDVIFV